MYTQCPQCLTYFQVTPEHLRIAQGNVRCGQCRNVFSALGNLTEEPPKTAYQDNEAELEDEIFIDEEELEGYDEGFVEDYEYEEAIAGEQEYSQDYEDEYADEYEEEYYIVEEANEEALQQPTNTDQPVDVEKTFVGSTSVGSASETDRQSSPQNLRPQIQPSNINSKLSEAIATIERLKQSYSSLSIRKLEPNPTTEYNTGEESKPDDGQSAEQSSSDKQPEAASPTQDSVYEPPSSAEIFSPFIEKHNEPQKPQAIEPAAPASHDIAIEHYPEDDDVDYEQALSALNDLKILEEEEANNEEQANEESSPAIKLEDLPASPMFDDHEAALQKEFSEEKIHAPLHQAPGQPKEQLLRQEPTTVPPAEPTSRDHHTAEVQTKSPDSEHGEKTGFKIRPSGAKPQKKPKSKKTKGSNQPQAESTKHLPAAIPKQLLDDFEPDQGHAEQSSWMNSLWAAGSLMFMAVFLIQTVYFKHNDLAQITRLRPWIETFCDYMACTLSLPSDVKQLELVSQDIRSHPKVKNALLVTTTIINNARFAQAFPGLQITFTDLNGQKVAMRRFAPREYLPPDIIQADGMPPNTPIQIELEMMDPGSNAVNFEFDFIPMR